MLPFKITSSFYEPLGRMMNVVGCQEVGPELLEPLNVGSNQMLDL